ncbi:LysM peptidoglycan-binding domain-containing protein [Miltoncostaea oceani]|uniref:CIS tube protein n=1 Tax=Miltoncostaea oceani TaxID=2843216 RepID=UPI001C3D265A|nr:LysM peptidoglycan-binding domain-containing protein [Miltoncostaea oceani]
MAIPDNLTKAYLRLESGEQIDCWFNPAEYTISKSNKWTVKPVVGQGMPTAQFGGGDAQKLTLDLLFDDADRADGDVRGITNSLFAAMSVDKAYASGKNSGRPPMIEFGWGATTTFKAVCDSLKVQFLLFRPNGTPVRAKATISLIQAEPTVGKGPQNPTTRGEAGLRTHVVRDGDSIQSVAHSAYGDATLWRRIAEANGIDDPMSLPRGTVLSIPTLPG